MGWRQPTKSGTGARCGDSTVTVVSVPKHVRHDEIYRVTEIVSAKRAEHADRIYKELLKAVRLGR